MDRWKGGLGDLALEKGLLLLRPSDAQNKNLHLGNFNIGKNSVVPGSRGLRKG